MGVGSWGKKKVGRWGDGGKRGNWELGVRSWGKKKVGGWEDGGMGGKKGLGSWELRVGEKRRWTEEG
uniref:Uncharacterized protein n=1 Tax=Desertifilum tharense IPPAS B-1220 TaxID=1781255 RepID=A0A1E5QPN2_9CYAN|nr:hypothetical protein BH720_04150 [Desertifilum tharense IPPAS B-1220]